MQRLELRVYRRHDPDLAVIAASGYNIGKIIRHALLSYAHNEPYFLLIDEPLNAELSDCKFFHYGVSFSDEAVCELLKSIISGRRNAFAKMLLRNCIIENCIESLFVADKKEFCRQVFQKNCSVKNITALPNVYFLSQYKEAEKDIHVLGKIIKVSPAKAKPLATDTLFVSPKSIQQPTVPAEDELTPQLATLQSFPSNAAEVQITIPNIADSEQSDDEFGGFRALLEGDLSSIF